MRIVTNNNEMFEYLILSKINYNEQHFFLFTKNENAFHQYQKVQKKTKIIGIQCHFYHGPSAQHRRLQLYL